MSESRVVLNSSEISISLKNISDLIIRDIEDVDQFIIVGIQTRGVELSRRLKTLIDNSLSSDIQIGFIDVSFHRDDLVTRGKLPELKETNLDFDINGKTVLLVDDVIFTGRTTKAALETLMSYGRPDAIKLAVLVDRGGRELPVQPDYCCTIIETNKNDSIKLVLSETDNTVDSVKLLETNEESPV